MARQLLIDKWSAAQEVHLTTALDLNLSDATVYRLGRLVITSVRLHDVGLVGGREPVTAVSEAFSDTEVSSFSAELAKLGLPTAFGKKTRREGKRMPGGVPQGSCLAHRGEGESGSRKDSGGGAHVGDAPVAVDSRPDTQWLQGFDEQWGCNYYYNTQTRESTWEVPAGGFVHWEEAADFPSAADKPPADVAEADTIAIGQQQQLVVSSGIGTAATDSPVPSSAGNGGDRVGGAGSGAGAAAPFQGAADSRAPVPGPRMLTEEDLLRAMGLLQDSGGPPGSGEGRTRGYADAPNQGTSSTVASQPAAASDEAADGRLGDGATAGGYGLGSGLLRQLLRPLSLPLQPQSSAALASTPQQRIVPSTAMSEEQLLARLSLEAVTCLPMPPPPQPPAPPPPSPPPPPATIPDVLETTGPVAPAEVMTPAKAPPPRMLTEEDILRSMGLLPVNPDINEGRHALVKPQLATAPVPAPVAGMTPRPPPPGFINSQGPPATQGAGGSPVAVEVVSSPATDGPDGGGEVSAGLPQEHQPQLQTPQNADGRHPPYPMPQQQPNAGHQTALFGPALPHSLETGPRPPLAPGFHPTVGPHHFGHGNQHHHHGHPHPHQHPRPYGTPGDFPPAPPLPFYHGIRPGAPHISAGLRAPPPGFGHPPPFSSPPPPPVDMWPPPGSPFGLPLMPILPPQQPPVPPAGFGMPYSPPPYPYEGHPYPPYGLPPYGIPPGFVPGDCPPLPPLYPPLPSFAMDGFPVAPGAPPAATPGLEGGVSPQQDHHYHYHTHHTQPPNHGIRPHHQGHHSQQQISEGSPPQPPSTKAPAPVGADMPLPGQAGATKGADVNRRAVTWTLEELERQLEIMAASEAVVGAADVRGAATQAGVRQGSEEGTGPYTGGRISRGPGATDDRQRREHKGKDRAARQHEGKHLGAAGFRRTGHSRSGVRTAETSSGDNGDDDSAFYDAFAGSAAPTSGALVQSHRGGVTTKPLVAEDDGTRRIMLDPSTAAYVRTLLPRSAAKYWMQRYSLFSRFDSLVQLDTEGWWSVTPEVLAAHQAERSRELCARGLVAMDACCGCGGNIIQMAGMFPVVIGVEISPKRVEMARHNASVYEVEHKCQFLCADFFQVGPSLKVDALFMSPPWGGPKYQHVNTFDVFFPLVGFNKSLFRLLDMTMNCVREQDGVVSAFLPRNTDLVQLAAVVPEHAIWEVERAYVNNKLKGITLYCHPGCTPDQPNVRLEAEVEYSVQAHTEVDR